MAVLNDRAYTLASLLDQAGERFADRDAIVDYDLTISYRQYRASVRSLAAVLADDGVEPGDRVVLAALKSHKSYVAAAAIMYCGAIYVPVDPLSPPASQERVLVNVKPAAVLGTRETLNRLVASAVDLPPRTYQLDDPETWARVESIEEARQIRAYEHAQAISSEDPAYIIHTSGSTGNPKGIVQTHRSALAYVSRAAHARGLTTRDRVAGMAPFNFDTSTFELYCAPWSGSTVVVFSEAELIMPASFFARSTRENVTVWYGVSSFFQQLMARCDLSAGQPDLRLVMFCGEPFPAPELHRFMAALPTARFHNVYGPAEVNECTAYVVGTYQDVAGSQAAEADVSDVPIGVPWSGVELIVCGDTGELVADGEVGELLVSGPTMMAEYFNDAELTSRSIIERNGRRWYRTGDLCRRRDDGNYMFLGRKDHQVKVRGVRVELEAVEDMIAKVPGVELAVVGLVANDDVAGGELAAAVTLDKTNLPSGIGAELSELSEPSEPSSELPIELTIKRWCQQHLSRQLVPTAVIVLEDFPRTSTGKIDRRAVRADLNKLSG